ncbi:phenylacetate--CoA ligase family protein [Plantactinospora sp. S1510]|uniref:Phenylacetate--CoA ligase family protein n=1 Tax=Plantactinospora alkalitolerans TaxID=2789879 RepID=A0ABS0GYE3_9ACTN|nr:phenylacetate--CoA ligase family protein [Plantactinospora alkalitolerans]MBF9131238.1 phenylacetate--CoA ligase family protein [Plantactinospora alkalitolerans]
MSETLRHPAPSTIDNSGLTLRERWRWGRLTVSGRLLGAVLRIVQAHPALWRRLARGYRPALDRFAEANARAVCALAALEVPAYRELLKAGRAGAHRSGARRRLRDFPETDKENYVAVHDAASRCWGGRLPDRGVVVDESAGSSGRPFNWPRSERELRAVHRDIAGYTSLVFPMRRPFVINAYSMGAWATGTTTGNAMARIAVVKNTGPDLDKIVDTLHEFGPDFDYLVTAYPPFLKHLRDRLDTDGFPWARYRISATCGGEGMTEALRGYLEERFRRVRSAYGASDLTIGMGAETRFTVWLRQRLQTDPALRVAVLGEDEQRLPMVFQYNPLATYLETNRRRELLCTMTSRDVLQPRLRYNVGDEALLLSYPRILELVRTDPARWAACQAALATERMTLPVLLLFGRRDSTVSYLGANLYPQDVEYGLYTGNPYAGEIGRFCLALVEGPDLETRPVVHIELRRALSEPARDELGAACRTGVLRHLAEVSRDFAQSLTEDPSAAELRVELHDPGAGPFAGARAGAGAGKIKNVYLVG